MDKRIENNIWGLKRRIQKRDKFSISIDDFRTIIVIISDFLKPSSSKYLFLFAGITSRLPITIGMISAF